MDQFFRSDPFVHQRISQAQKNTTSQLEYNYVVLEIINNWEYVKDLFRRIKEGKVYLLDPMEATWVQFLSTTDINTFKDPEAFEKRMLKPLV